MRKCEIKKKTPIKGGRFMKKFSIIAILTIAAMLVFAGFAMAAPGDYDPDVTGIYYTEQLTDNYTDSTGTVYSYVYGDLFLNPHFNSQGDVRTTVGDWQIFNANYTGELNVPYFKTDAGDPDFHSTYQRNVFGQLVHTDFQLNTNSCASCHMTHTAQSRGLLFRNGVYSTCAACHDGTLGFLNVFAIPGVTNPFGGSQTAGTFAASKSRNSSVHLASDTMTLSAAPGGNRMNANVPTDGEGDAWDAGWDADFNCASCHAPHGSYSIRLLHFNPANISLRPVVSGSRTGGLWYEARVLAQAVEGDGWKYTATAGPRGGWIYGYSGATSVGGVRHPRFWSRIWYDGFYNPNTVGGPLASVNGFGLLNRFFSVKYGNGYATQDADELAAMIAFLEAGGNGIDPIAPGSFDPANLRIDAGGVVAVAASFNAVDPMDYVLPQYSSDYINTNSYTGITANRASGDDRYAYNLYCAACHTDYLSDGASAGLQGVYSQAYRHTINRGGTSGGTMQVTGNAGNLLCVSCHYVHGADSSFMQLANAELVDANTQFAGANDVNHSSALKRYINMAVCWTCHANSRAGLIKNSEWYWDGYGDGRGTW
jgi:predicted CXXCH cytochrome family protein